MNRQKVLVILAAMAVLAGLLTMSAPARAQTAVFINEIHYDNTGTDTGEAIEIAGPAGTDLTGWSLVLYNGNGGAVYDTDPLSGTIPDQAGGFGFVVMNYPTNGIQNGSPDGMALVDAGSNVIQFLSYEGTFVAVGGPANGMTSTDIGASENGSGPVGNSLQLTGTGTQYEDFTWAAEGPNTFGAVNTGQTFLGGPADPVINEFVFNHTGTDTHEFVELAGAASADYSGLTLLQIEGDGTGAGVVDSVIPAGTTDSSGYWTTGFLSNIFENGTVSVLLVEGFSGALGQDLDVDNNGVLDSTPWTRVVDSVAVTDGGSGDQAYGGTSLVPGYDGNSFTVGGASRIPDRTDTNTSADWVRNDFDGAGLPGFTGTPDPGEALNTPGAANEIIPPAIPQLVINEIDYDQPGTDTAEFVEIKNVGSGPASLSGVTLELVNGTGGGAAIYDTIALPAATLAAGDYFVVCANAAIVANCDLDDDPDTNFIQNGAPDAVGLRFNGTLIDAVSYEGDTGAPYIEGSGAGLEDAGADGSISRCPDGVDTDQNNVDLVFTATSSPGLENVCPPPPPVESCGDPFTPIYQVQGSGAASPLAGTEVAIEGVVIGDFQNNASPDNGNLNGFHVQDSAGDGDAATSDGIFVFAPGGMDLAVGDGVRVRGLVSEFFGLTEITASQIWLCSNGNTVAPTSLSLPVTDVGDFEAFEGMLVTFPQALVISEYFNFDRFGEIVLTSDRFLSPTAEFEPGPDAVLAAQDYLLNRITLDDGRTNQNPDPAIHPDGNVFDLTNLFRGGDTVQNVTGVLDYAFGLYRIQPTQGADYTKTNLRPSLPDEVGGSLKVAAFNVLNYFTTIDNSGPICGPQANQGCRGADTPEEFTRQRDKIIAALAAIDADVVGLIEIENHPGDVPTADLVSGLNAAMGAGTYDYIATGAIGADAIRVAYIYKPASVTPVGGYAVLDTSVDPRFLDDFNRPVLAQTFQENASGGVFTTAVNHLKSKGSDCNAVGDPNTGDGSGNCNLTRLAAAQALVDWLATDPTGSGDPDFLIIGDLNSYDKEDPIDAILAGSDDLPSSADDFTDLLFSFNGEGAYSYVFDGRIGYLDYALANAPLLPQVTGTTAWHINADEPDLIDYDMTFKGPNQDLIYAPDAYRSSDHDPVIVGLDLNVPPDCSAAAPSLATLWPANHQMVAIEVLGVTDLDGDPITITIDNIFQDEAVDAPGSGNTAPDGQGVGTSTAEVRAERAGSGNGRYYHISFTATDSYANSCSSVVKVSVPKSQGKNGAAVDDGPLFDSTAVQ